jgi:ELWxxDGT repeat protein
MITSPSPHRIPASIASLLLSMTCGAFSVEPHLVADLNAGEENSRPSQFTVVDDRLYFVADAGDGAALWSTDGTSEGTMRAGEATLGIESVAVFEGAVLYLARVPANPPLEGHKQDWTLNAVSAGPQRSTLLRNLGTSGASQLTSTAVGVSFGVWDGQATELWVSDGTTAGTQPLGAFVFHPDGEHHRLVEPGRGKVYFAGLSSLWTTDGSVAGTRQIAELPATPSQLTSVGDRLFFVTGGELWVSDGTAEGTESRASIGEPGPDRLAALGDRLFFRAGSSLWLSDGSEEGTIRILDVDCSGPDCVQLALWPYLLPRQTPAVGRSDGFYFVTHDGLHGLEPWISDGTQRGTTLLKDIYPGAASSALHGFRADLLLGRTLFFDVPVQYSGDGAGGVRDHSEHSLWKTDGTPAGTVPILGVAGEDEVFLSGCAGDCDDRPPLAIAGHTLFFQAADPAHGVELWALPLTDFLDRPFRRGDTNTDGALDLSDAIATLGYLFLGSDAPGCLDAADTNDSGAVDLSDAVFTLSFLFLGGPAPAAPFGGCGADPADDALDCLAAAPCR